MRGHLRANWYKIVPADQGNGHLPDATKLQVYLNTAIGFTVAKPEIESVVRRVTKDRETGAKQR
jgi:hypothetical protein